MIQLSFDEKFPQRWFPDLQWHIEESFIKYHKGNPEVYRLFKRFCAEVRTKGRPHYGAKAIMERIRWHMEVDTMGEDFKLNNSYTSCYARLLVSEDKSFDTFFELRHTPGTL